MSGFKLVLDLPNGRKVWLNIYQMVKMEKTVEGRYFLYMVNGEIYEIDRKTASAVENYLEDR